MSTPALMPPSTIRDRLDRIVRTSKRKERLEHAADLAETYAALRTALDLLAGEKRLMLPEEVSDQAFAGALEGAVAATRKRDRRRAIEGLVDAYTAAFYTYDNLKFSTGSRGGRGGNILFDSSKETWDNTRLARAHAAEAEGREIYRDVRLVTAADGSLTDCRPRRSRISVSKPGTASGLDGAGIDAEFGRWLVKQNKTHLTTLPAWIKQTLPNTDPEHPTDDQRRAYDAAVTAEYEAFEKELFENRYCKVGDLPLPGIQLGHRLLRLSIPIEEDDFRNTGCGSEIYEGPFRAPVPPEIDYAELVRRYVGRLKTLPRSVYDLGAITEAAIHDFHDRDLGRSDPFVLRMFVKGSKLALAHPDFVQHIEVISAADGTGPPPASIAEWLRTGGAMNLCIAVHSAWRQMLAGAVAPPSQAGVLPQGLLTHSEFTARFLNLCQPFTTPGNMGAFDSDGVGNSSDTTRAFWEDSNAVLQEAQQVADAYAVMWELARDNLGQQGLWTERETIKLSAAEARAYILYLAAKKMVSNRYLTIYSPAYLAIMDAIENLVDVPISSEDVVPVGGGDRSRDGHRVLPTRPRRGDLISADRCRNHFHRIRCHAYQRGSTRPPVSLDRQFRAASRTTRQGDRSSGGQPAYPSAYGENRELR